MDTAKKEICRILEELPDDATFEDIQYQIYVRQQIRQGLDDADAGPSVTTRRSER